MWEHLNKKEQLHFLRLWIKKITKKHTDFSIKRHIVKHAKEIYQKDPRKWSASMRNLLEIFEGIHNIKPHPAEQLERLNNKYQKDKHRYTAPPKN
ncbi:MAG: hypothetical protein A2406_04025 [Candidatus Komeilibacteria bacterium RIFOXYC1_FULL_37_11]|uniref:Uncharacterized protein n=1 Tax=Candidatus Komeilibacteria bacterium RIFOXYC1_FULL_37_11 TaxID=1798555 RepID=A0A1G2BX35_9BACT|nr:MAG: hypothetical protein A2406_04025 [Candidatus Komeilibacteria bacterium RIFOXYC1_FULL_37_11]OGY95851.1 MAG: hypothetical protein A2611_03695 [Candidatus Komeilibacteria bacterium RIFOXYD1_FULL_37_29]OGY97358.1 MAG: hypothetical protein A2543_01170 [Candidatus Komeilibacteria bacterium RIFOXYD2_FULL_37_8]